MVSFPDELIVERIFSCYEVIHTVYVFCELSPSAFGGRGSSAVERATPGEEVPGSIPAVAARSLQVGSVSV